MFCLKGKNSLTPQLHGEMFWQPWDVSKLLMMSHSGVVVMSHSVVVVMSHSVRDVVNF